MRYTLLDVPVAVSVVSDSGMSRLPLLASGDDSEPIIIAVMRLVRNGDLIAGGSPRRNAHQSAANFQLSMSTVIPTECSQTLIPNTKNSDRHTPFCIS